MLQTGATKSFFSYEHDLAISEQECDCAVMTLVQVVNEAEALAYSSGDSRKDGDNKILHRDQTRVSLTCRLVPKVHKNLFRL